MTFLKSLLIVLFLTSHAFAQSKRFIHSVSFWVLTHPFAAIKVKKTNTACLEIYQQPDLVLRLDSFGNGGKLDAFRHIFFMAAFHQKVRTKSLRKLGLAHENGNYNQFLKGESQIYWRHDSLSMVMDLHNNEVAFALNDCKKKISLDSLKAQVIQCITDGKALIMKRNKAGKLLKCDGTEFKPDSTTISWYLPKCLVASNKPYRD